MKTESAASPAAMHRLCGETSPWEFSMLKIRLGRKRSFKFVLLVEENSSNGVKKIFESVKGKMGMN